MLEFDTICGEGKNHTGNINMKTLMKTTMKTIMKSSLCALAALFIASPALADVLDTTLFSKKSVLTISGYAGSTTLANFPVLVRLSAGSPSGFAYADVTNGDIRFADSNGNSLPFEIEKWDASGESHVWVSVPSLSGQATTITMYYGAITGKLPPVDATGVWRLAGYQNVHHFSDASGYMDIESSANNLTVTRQGANTVDAAGVLGSSLATDDGSYKGLKVETDSSWMWGAGGTVTFSVWGKRESDTNNTRFLFGTADLSGRASASTFIVNVNGTTASGTIPSVGGWTLYTVVIDGTSLSLYIDGALADSKTCSLPAASAALYWGSNGSSRWKGSTDEARLRNVADSADWVKACYDTIHDPGFVAAAAVETQSTTAPTFTNGATGTPVEATKFASRIPLTISGYDGSDAIENLPVLVRLGSISAQGFSVSALASDGSNFRFGDAKGNNLPFEIDTWDTTSGKNVWVTVPYVEGTGTTIYLYFDTSATLAANDSAAVWTNACYKNVMHYQSTMDASGGYDSTTINTGLTTANTTIGTAYGKIGDGADTTSGSSTGYKFTLGDAAWGKGDPITFSTWANTDTSSGSRTLFGDYNGTGAYYVYPTTSASVQIGRRGSVNTVSLAHGDSKGQWCYFTFVCDGSVTKVYANGAYEGMVATPLPVMSAFAWGYGNGGRHKGYCDESRIHAVAESADFIAASYKAMTDASFIVAGDVEPAQTSYKPEILSADPALNFIEVKTRLTAFEAGASSVSLTLLYGKSSDALTSEYSLGTLTQPGTVTRTLSGLDFSSTYYLKVKAVDNLNNEAMSEVVEVATGADTRMDTTPFSYKSTGTVGGYAGSTRLENFPVLVRIAANSPTDFSYEDCAEDGSDIRFTDVNGIMIPHEIDTWDTNGTSLVWVQVPRLSGTTTELTMYFGADDPPSLPAVTAADVWTDANYNAVWHFSGSAKESANGLTDSGSSGTPDYTAATFGVGTCFKAADNATLGYDVDSKWTTLGEGSTLTVSTWSKYDGSSASCARMLSCMSDWQKTAGWELTIQNAVDEITVGSSSKSQYQYTASGVGPGSGNVYLTVVYNADGNAQLYVNGALAYSKTLNNVVTPTEKLWIGSLKGSERKWNGSLDEIRIHRDAESADWVKACYDTMASTSFVTMDDVTAVGGVQPLAIRSNGATLSGTTATITGRLANLGTGATSADVTLYYGTSANVEGGTAVGPAAFMDKADLSDTLNNLTPGATYYYAYKAVNNLSATAWSATNSFTVEASTRFSDTLSIAVQNCQMTVTGSITEWGIGTTKVELLVGTSADNLAVVQTVNLTEKPVGDQAVFDPITNPVGSYFVAIRATTTYNDIEWVRVTTSTAQTLADTSTYTWKGGKGAWTDSAMWTSADTGAGGYPTAGCSVVFPAYGRTENVVSLDAGPGALAAITIDSASRYTFRSTSLSSVRGMTAPTLTMSGAGNGTLVLDAVSIKGTADDVCFNTLAGLKCLVLENSAGFAYPREADNSQLELSLVTGGKLTPYFTTGIQIGKLKVGRSINNIAPAGANLITFGGFENIGDLGYCQLSSDGLVAFTDVSGITQIGGEGTYENNPSQIKVAPEFSFGNASGNRGIATISNNVVVVLAPETMKQGFDGATSLDNVYVDSATTLTADATVNAVLLNGDLDLDGHTLTVVSGVVRMKIGGNGSVKNGTLRVHRPLLVTDNTNNTNERFTAEIETVGNDDPWAPMLDVWAMGGSKPTAALSNFTGRIVWPFNTFSFKSARTATNYVIDMKTGEVSTGSHNADYVVRGIGGNCQLKTGMFNNTVWVGDCNDDQFAKMGANEIANWGYVVSTNGVLAPGYLSYDGGRRGRMIMVSTKERVVNFLMDEGGTLQIAIHADGDNTYLKMSDIDTSYGWNQYLNVTLAGTLDIRESGKINPGVAYPVVFYHPGKRLNDSKFDYLKVNGEASTGYKVEYDVEQPDGSYAVTVTKKGNAGTVIIVR